MTQTYKTKDKPIPMTTLVDKKEEWEKEFNKKWPNTAGTFCSLKSRDSVMEFIRSLLLDQKQEIIRIGKKEIEIIKNMGEGYVSDEYDAIDAISDLIKKIKQL